MGTRGIMVGRDRCSQVHAGDGGQEKSDRSMTGPFTDVSLVAGAAGWRAPRPAALRKIEQNLQVFDDLGGNV